MNQLIKRGEDLIIVYTWFEDNKVYVKYFLNGREINSLDELTDAQIGFLRESNSDFCDEENLTLYSY